MDLFERFLWVRAHPARTYAMYDAMSAGDRLLHKEFEALLSNL